MFSSDTPTVLASRPVTREAEIRTGFLGIDSLYLVLEYPHSDVYERWLGYAGSLSNPKLYKGIVADDFVLRRGALGYKLSVWNADARLFLTDHVEDRLRGTVYEGQGMGVMLQLGPKWLSQFCQIHAVERFRNNIIGQLMYFGVNNPADYPCRINRIDVALDVVGLAVDSLSLDDWRQQWVGYGALSSVYFNRKTRKLETLTFGTSQGSVRFKVYDKQAESLKSGSGGFWHSVWGLPEDDWFTPVARFEWTVKCHAGRFTGMRYLSDFSMDGFMQVLNYASLKWGSLRVPQDDDSNSSRWPLSPLWQDIRALIDNWSFNYDKIAERDYDLQPDLKSTYLRAAAGWLAGLRARVGIENGTLGPAKLAEALMYLEDVNLSVDNKAAEKWKVLDRLARRR